MTTLRIADRLALPLDAVTQTFCIFGKRGSGKTNGACVLVEELLKAAQPVVVLDPVDAWWGLKAGFDGKGPGFSVYVFGGPHGDLPLEPSAGALIADVAAHQRIPLVLSMSQWSGGERARFVTDFARRLLQVNREPLMVVCEEADAFIPQRPMKGEEAMLGAMDRLIRWGRQSGIGCTIVTQRSAKVNKDVTTQAETLIAFRTTGPQDRDAIDNWIRYHAGDEKREEVLSTLPALPTGTAWVWSPEWLEILKRVAFRRRETFDSAATPKPGEAARQPKHLAAVDLDQLRTQMTETVEKAKADDPRELRKQIAELQQQIKARPVAVAPKQARIEVPVLKERQLARVETLVDRFGKALAGAMQQHAAISEPLQQLVSAVHAVARQTASPSAVVPRATPRPAVAAPLAVSTIDDGTLSEPERRILGSLAWWEAAGIAQPSRHQVAFGARYSVNGHFNNMVGGLRLKGLIEYPQGDHVALTATGRGMVMAPETPVTRGELVAMALSILRKEPQRRLFAAVVDAGAEVSREDLAQRCRYSVNGHFNNMVGSLRILGLIRYPRGNYVALGEMFEAL